MSGERKSIRGMLNEHNQQLRRELQDEEESRAAARRKKEVENARRAPEIASGRRGTTGAMTFARIVGLTVIVLVAFFSMAAGPKVAEKALPVLVVSSITFYFLPTIEASLRQHASLTSIALVNVFFGWTLVGWVAVIAWACAGSSKPAPARPATSVLASSPPTAPTRAEPVVSAAPPPAAQTISVADELQKLAALRDQGILTHDEFDQQKARMLS